MVVAPVAVVCTSFCCEAGTAFRTRTVPPPVNRWSDSRVAVVETAAVVVVETAVVVAAETADIVVAAAVAALDIVAVDSRW